MGVGVLISLCPCGNAASRGGRETWWVPKIACDLREIWGTRYLVHDGNSHTIPDMANYPLAGVSTLNLLGLTRCENRSTGCSE